MENFSTPYKESLFKYQGYQHRCRALEFKFTLSAIQFLSNQTAEAPVFKFKATSSVFQIACHRKTNVECLQFLSIAAKKPAATLRFR